MLRKSLMCSFSLPDTRWFWGVSLAVCVALDAAALFYQHVLKVYPCEICIYVRVWLVGIALVSLCGLLSLRWSLAKLLFSLAGLVLSLGLAHETWLLLGIEYGFGHAGSCSFFANFPDWAPLDKWVPAMFEVQELCSATPSVLLGITMADALALVSLAYIAVFACASIGAFRRVF